MFLQDISDHDSPQVPLFIITKTYSFINPSLPYCDISFICCFPLFILILNHLVSVNSVKHSFHVRCYEKISTVSFRFIATISLFLLSLISPSLTCFVHSILNIIVKITFTTFFICEEIIQHSLPCMRLDIAVEKISVIIFSEFCYSL